MSRPESLDREYGCGETRERDELGDVYDLRDERGGARQAAQGRQDQPGTSLTCAGLEFNLRECLCSLPLVENVAGHPIHHRIVDAVWWCSRCGVRIRLSRVGGIV